MNGWLREADDGALLLALHIQPGAKRTGFAGLHGEAAKVRLAAPPVDGKANAALCAFLADICGAPRSAVTLLGGERARAKRIRIAPGPGRAERLRAALAATETAA
ncbi:MAG: DUF167 family protein [Azoarcus sp.]|jgi:uncharacterized protein (TIGR00251 family)|nr:DUF167 family protein [Azoarcus sp.]